MGYISREDFLKEQTRKAEGRSFGDSPRVGYFKLENDGDEAVVRLFYGNEEDVYNDILITHKITENGKFRRVNCLRNFNEPMDKCPLCKAGEQPQQRLYIKLVEYTRNEDGSYTAVPKIWERPTSYVNKLLDKLAEYGDLTDNMFKIRRHGKAGDMKTEYSIDLANPNVYNSSIYKKDFSAFDNYNVVGTAVLDKSFEELAAMTGATTTKSDEVPWDTTTTTAPRKVTY